jgi:hypothetical protein
MTFTMTEKEELALELFMKPHREIHKCGPKSTMYRLILGFDSGIGVSCRVECSVCGCRENITDYDVW